MIKERRRTLPWLRRVLVLTAVAAVAIFISAGGASAAPPTALINGDTVTGGAGSQEAQIATAQGFAVTVVGGATWSSMTQAQFGTYDVLIIGDPTCRSLAGSVTSSAGVWAPVVMGHAGGRTLAGNRILVGTDPVWHDGGNAFSARATIIREGIAFAGKQPGRTGLYFDSSCASASQVIPTLNQLSEGSGAWSAGFPPCGGSASLIASNPSFATLTSASLQGWGCSVHSSYPTFPTDWSALAVATDTAPVTCGIDPADGLTHCGQAYILIAGSSIVLLSGSISVTPLTSTNPAFTDHTVTAHVTAGGSPLVGQVVTWTVTGQNAGAVGTCVPVGCVTNASGDVSFTYHDTNGAGSDTIKASFTDAAGSLQAATAAKDWVAPLEADLQLVSKLDSADPVLHGDTFSYTVTVRNNGPAPATGVVITDTLPAGLSFVGGGGCSAVGQVVTCPVGSLAVGASASVTFTVHADAAGTMVDKASVSGDQPDVDPTNNARTESTTVNPVAGLSVDKSGTVSMYWGQDATYTIVVSNAGPDTATGVEVTDSISAPGTFVSGTAAGGACTIVAGLVHCPVGTIAAGDSSVVTLVVTGDEPGTIKDKAHAAGNEFEVDLTDNAGEASTEVLTHPTSLTYTGDTTSDYHDPATLSATLVDDVTGTPLSGKTVDFALDAQSCTDTTSGAGVASCSITPNESAGSYPLSATYAGGALYDGSSATETFVVTLEETVTVYTGATAPVLNLSSLLLSATLKEDGVTPIAGRNVWLTIGTGGSAQSCLDTTNAVGAASCSILVSQAAGMQPLSAKFSGDAFYLASSDTASVKVYSARSIKQDALAALTALNTAVTCTKSKGKDGKEHDDDESCASRFASPLRKVTRSLNPAWWNTDGIHLTLNGCGVFDNEKAAASQLRALLKSKKLSAAQKAAIQAIIDQLVQADQILAQTAVDEATAAGGNAKKLALANKALAKAAALIAAGKPDEAINQYRIAWEKAQQSLGRKVCGDDGHEDEDGHHDHSDDDDH